LDDEEKVARLDSERVRQRHLGGPFVARLCHNFQGGALERYATPTHVRHPISSNFKVCDVK